MCKKTKIIIIDDTQKISRPHAPGFDGVVVVWKA